jgi:hypothetical protein
VGVGEETRDMLDAAPQEMQKRWFADAKFGGAKD